MPDAAGWPTVAEVFVKVQLAAPGPISPVIQSGVGAVLRGVVAEFQSAPGPQGYGGTGRRFDTVTETRLFDGSGYSEQYVGDIVPGTPLIAGLWNKTQSPSVTLKTGDNGIGSNVLVLVSAPGSLYGNCLVFPRGVQNVSVAATWGFAATVPADVCEAVLCETASRLLVQAFVPLTGVGEDVKLEDFEINTSSGISVWGQSSPIAVFHSIYQNAVRRYRVGNAPALKQLAASRRMS